MAEVTRTEETGAHWQLGELTDVETDSLLRLAGIYTADLTATMTSSSAPSPNSMVASTEFSSTYAAWKACDKLTSTYWATTTAGVLPCWIWYSFGSANSKQIRRYSIRARSDSSVTGPEDWTFEGYTGTEWVVLATEAGVVFSAGEQKFFNVPEHGGYYAYRLSISANNGGSTTNIAEITLHEIATYQTPGNRISPPLDVTAAGTYANSRVTWSATTPTNTSLAIHGFVTGETAILAEAVGTGDGVATVFTLDNYPSVRLDDLVVKIDGTATTAYTRVGRTLTFGAAPGDTLAITADYTGVDWPINEQVEVQTLDLDSPTGGTFKLGDGTTWTADLAYNATAATVEAALEGLYGAGNVGVTGIVDSLNILETYTTVGTHSWTVPTGVNNVAALVVAGGGGGGDRVGGAGAGGGIIWETQFSVTPTDVLTVTVGAGGAGDTGGTNGSSGADGADSVFDTLTAKGGGGGGGYLALPGRDGGSGGGGGGYLGGTKGSAIDTDPPNLVYQGHDGGAYTANYAGGGGGGAGAAGQNGQGSNIGGYGGEGLDYSSYFGTGYGDDGWFAGGGGGSGYNSGTHQAAGGDGGGGIGGNRTQGPGAGLANSGGGGGARERTGGAGNGGSGIVIIAAYTYTFTVTFPLSIGDSGLVADFTGLTYV